MPGVSQTELEEFFTRSKRGDRKRIAKALGRVAAIESKVLGEWTSAQALDEKRLEFRLRRADRALRRQLLDDLTGATSGKRGLKTTDTPDGSRIVVDGETPKRISAARNRAAATTNAVLLALKRTDRDHRARYREMGASHAEQLGTAYGTAGDVSGLAQRQDEIRGRIGELDEALSEVERADDQEDLAKERDDIEEAYDDDIKKLGAALTDQAMGRASHWRTAPRVATARKQIQSLGVPRQSAGNTMQGSNRATYRGAMHRGAVKTGATHFERKTIFKKEPDAS